MNFYHLLEKSKEYLVLAKEYKLNSDEKITASLELAALLMQMSREIESIEEKQNNQKQHQFLSDKQTRQFFNTLTDKVYRSPNPKTITSYISKNIKQHGAPSGVSWLEQQLLKKIPLLSTINPQFCLSQIKKKISKETRPFILPYGEFQLSKQLQEKSFENQHLNLNYLGEAVLCESGAEEQCQRYINLVFTPKISAISIKLSSLFSQNHQLNHQSLLREVLKKVSKICDTVLKNNPKLLIYFDMELFQDLYFTIDFFEQLLTINAYKSLKFGITLQAYLPQSFDCQKKLTKWAIERVENDGEPIRIRLVKGANKQLESILSSQNFQDPPLYNSKLKVDANLKLMLQYGAVSQHAHAVHIGVGSHNIFDIAYTLIERAEKNTEAFVGFEMIYGMAPSIYKSLQLLTDNILLYTPTVSPDQMDYANAYLFRRIDEQTDPENFLTHLFTMEPGSKEWINQAEQFKNCFTLLDTIQNDPVPYETPSLSVKSKTFQNYPNINWAYKNHFESIDQYYTNKTLKIPSIIPYTIGNQLITDSPQLLSGINPNTGDHFYSVALLQNKDIDDLYLIAKNHHTKQSLETYEDWGNSIKRYLQKHKESICTLLQDDVAKPLDEGLNELNEAIDFINFYFNSYKTLVKTSHSIKEKGPCLICSPWNFPLAIPIGCIFSALICGNAVLFKPAPEATLIGWIVCNAFWEAGVPKESLQFIPCDETLTGKNIIQHPELKLLSLTGSDKTADYFYSLNPTLDIIAETGGKNAILISNLSDLDDAVEDILHSSFSYAGQKCSASSIILCHKDILRHTNFLNQLKESCKSIITASAKYKGCKVPPLIRKPNSALLTALTTLEEGEEWLVKPKQNTDNPQLWSPGIKLGIKKDSLFAQTEYFGPIIGIAEIESLENGIHWINESKYGLTAGLQSLDDTEHLKFIKYCKTGNIYINKPITGAIVGLQPFGGRRHSSYGLGYKAGGNHYLYQYAHISKIEKSSKLKLKGVNLSPSIKHVLKKLLKSNYPEAETRLIQFNKELKSLTKLDIKPTVLGEDNIMFCETKPGLIYLIDPKDTLLDMLSIISFCTLANNKLLILSNSNYQKKVPLDKLSDYLPFSLKQISDHDINNLLKTSQYQSIRTINKEINPFLKTIHNQHHYSLTGPISSFLKKECLNHLREKSVSRKKHRFGFIPENF